MRLKYRVYAGHQIRFPIYCTALRFLSELPSDPIPLLEYLGNVRRQLARDLGSIFNGLGGTDLGTLAINRNFSAEQSAVLLRPVIHHLLGFGHIICVLSINFKLWLFEQTETIDLNIADEPRRHTVAIMARC